MSGDSETHRARILAHADVAGQARDQRWPLEHLHRRKMDRVEGPDGLERERATGTQEHVVSHRHDIASRDKRLETHDRATLLTTRQPARDPRADQRAMSLSESQSGRNTPVGARIVACAGASCSSNAARSALVSTYTSRMSADACLPVATFFVE